MMKKISKNALVLGYLKRYKYINRSRALTHFNIWDLHYQIYILRGKGFSIEYEKEKYRYQLK